MRSDQHDNYEASDDVLAKIKSALPYFEGNYDPHAYINWELVVDSEFQKHVLSEKQKVMCAVTPHTFITTDKNARTQIII